MRGHRLEACIDFSLTTVSGFCHPTRDVVLENSLVKLMEDVGCYACEYIAVGKIRPEGVDGSKTVIGKFRWVFAISFLSQDASCGSRIARVGEKSGATLLRIYNTPWTGTFFATSDKALLGIISDVRCQNGIDGPNESISALHVDTICPHINQGLEKGAHTFMEQLIAFERPAFL